MLLILGVLAYIAVLIVIFALMRAAGDANKAAERMFRENPKTSG